MKFGNFSKKAGFVFSVLSAIIISFSSCGGVEIGLGASVDTRAPELTIQNPPVGSVIRDVFALSGTCGDDGTIKSITVVLNQTDNTALSYTFEGAFDQKEGVWSCEINPLDKKSPMLDGSYEVTVTIKDNADRETIRQRQFSIDNTAPVLAITRPSSVIPTGSDPEKYSATDYDSYGQDFVIEGHVADTCERRYISVDIFDLQGNLKYSTLNATDDSQKRIKIDSDFSTTIASFGDEAYTAIYGDDDEAGTQKFFCEITVYDNARKYPVDSSKLVPEDLVGNSAKYFYMYEGELYNSIFDTYGMTNAYRLLNDSFSEEDSRNLDTTLSPKEAKKKLEDEAYKETRGFLSLNPKNNPYFKVSGHEALDKEAMENGTVFEDDNNKITNNSTIVVEVYPGLDQTPLIQDNLGLYLLQADYKGNPIDSDGNEVKAEDAEKIWLVRPLTDKDGTAILTEEDNAEEIAARKSLISKIGSTYKFTVYLTTKELTANGKELAANNYYLFGVQGWDKKAVPVKNADSVLGFMLVESGTAPSLTIKTITPEWITTNVNSAETPDLVDENAVKTFSVEMAFAGDAPYRLSRTVNDGEPVDVLKISYDYRLTDYSDKYTPEAGASSGTIKYILTGSNNLTSTKEINFKVDNERPTVGEIEVPSVNVTEKSSFTFKGTVSDGDADTNSEIADVEMKISSLDDKGNVILESAWISVGNTNKWEHTVVFQEDKELKNIFAKEGLKKIEVYAVDKAGNKSVVKQSSFIYDISRPELTVQSYKMGTDSAKQIKSEFFISEAFAISGKATDSYGIDAASLKLIQVKGTGDDAVTIEIPIENINDKGEWTVGNLPRNTEAGKINEALVANDDYTFTISVTDLTGSKTETSAAYKVSIDLEAPVVVITSPSEKEILSGDTTRITGTLDDGNGTGISGYYYKFVKAGENALNVNWTEVATKATNFSFYKDLISGNNANASALCEGNWSLFVKAVDEAGNESDVAEQSFAVDMNDPVLTSTITTGNSCILQSGLYYFKGDLSGTASANDTNEPDKIRIEFKLGTEVIKPTMNNGNWTISASSFTANTPTTLSITAYDAVGNHTKKEYQVYYDITAPSVNVAVSALKDGDKVNSFPLTIYGTADDGTGIGATVIYYSLDDSDDDIEPTSELVAASSSWTKEINATGLTEGNKVLKLKIKDALNNESEVTKITFIYDKYDPTLTETGIGESGATVSSDITLQGTAGDTYGIDSIEITDSANEDSRWTIASSDMTESDGTLTWSMSIALGTEANTLADGRHNFTIIAKDLAGKQTKLTRSVLVDTTAPEVLAITAPATDDEATGTNAISNATYKFTGTAQDSGSGIANFSYVFTHDSTAPAAGWSEPEPAGNGEWELIKTLTAAPSANCLEEGEWYLFVKATDKAGNTVTAPVSRHFWIDMGTPSVTDVNIAGGTHYFKTNALTVTGKSIDTHGLKETGAVVIKKTAEGDTVVDEILASIDASAVGPDGSWSATIAADSIPSDGTPVTITIESTDIVGKTSGVNTYTVCKDMVAPVVTALPASNAAMAYQNSVNIQFSGTAIDTNLDEVKAELYKNNETTATSATTLSPDRTTGAWTWKVYDLDQASYKLKVTAKDKAQNVTTYETGSITIDTTAPKTTVNGTSLYKADGTAAESSLSDGTVEQIEKKYAQSSYTLSGTVSDDNFETLVIKENGTAKTVTLTGSEWTYTPAAFTAGTEVTNNYTITVTDKANNIASYSLTVVYDTKAPEIVITSPAATYYPTVPDANGTVIDSGSGIKKVEYSTNTSPWTEIDLSGGMWNVDFSTMTDEGSVTLYVRAEDNLGNATAVPEQVTFSFDKQVPQIAKTHGTLQAYYKAGDTVTLKGTAYDTNKLVRIEISDTLNGTATTYSTANTDEITITNGTIADAKSDESKIIWSKELTFAANSDRDGQHTITIVATDDAGRTSTITESFVVDTHAPTLSADDITYPTVYETASSTGAFSGKAKDDVTGVNITSGVARIKVKYVDGTNESAERVVNGTTAWFDTISFNNITKADSDTKIFGTSGEKKIKVKAIDTAGNETEWVEKSFNYDKDAPTAALASYNIATNDAAPFTYGSTNTTTTDFAVSKAFMMSGTLSDDWGIPADGAVRITQRKGAADATEVELSGLDYTYNQSTKTWTISGLPRKPDTPADTEVQTADYYYTIYVTDNAGKTNSKTIKVTVDNTPPTVTFKNPSNNLEATTSAAISGSMYNFKVEARDQGESDVGLASYSYAFTDSASEPSSWIIKDNVTDGEFTINMNLVSGTNRNGLESDKLCEGNWFFHFKATDKAGNESTDAYRYFYIDKSEPTLTTSVTSGTNTIENSNTFFFKTELTGTTVATDTYAMAGTKPVTYKIGETEVTPTTTVNDGVTTWSIASDNAAFTGTYQTLTITATDIIGRITTNTYNIYKDETAPELSIIQPAENANIDQTSIQASVSIVENGIGIQDFEYRIKKAADTNWGAWTSTTYTPGAAIAQLTLDLDTNNQGEIYLQFRATDKLGNSKATAENRKFYYDKDDPGVTREDTTTTYQSTEPFTLSGKAYDTYKLARVEISDDYGTGTVYSSAAATPTVTITGNINNAHDSESAVTWSKTFTTTGDGALAEGSHNFKVTAYDVSGRSKSTQTKNVFVDVTGPVINTIIVPSTTLTEEYLFKFNGTAHDYYDDSNKDSGIKMVEVQITNSGVSASDTETETATGWIEASGLTSWNAAIIFNSTTHPVFGTEGVKTVHVRATDEAGNVGTIVTKNFVYDKASPTLEDVEYTPANGTAFALSTTATIPEFEVNGQFSLSGKAKDTNGVKEIVITQKINDGSEKQIEKITVAGGAQNAIWSTNAALPRDPEHPETPMASITSGEYFYTITVTDIAGNDTSITEATAKSVSKTFKAKIDRSAPTIKSITNPSSDTSNTGANAISVVSFTFRGAAADDVGGTTAQTGLEAVWYKIIAQNTAAPAAPTTNTTVDGTWTRAGFTKASNTTSWSFSQAFKTKGATGEGIEEGLYKVAVYAVDKAGNVSAAASQIFDVDMNAPEIETVVDGTALAESMTQTKTGAYTFKYKVTESNGLAAYNPVITVCRDNVELTKGTDYSISGVVGEYQTVTITNHTDGLYEYTISATDLVGKNSTVRRNILLDTTAPVISVMSPDLSAWQNATSVTLNGGAEDKSGTKAVWYSCGAGSMPTIPSTNTTTDSSWTGNGWTKATGSTSWRFTVTGDESLGSTGKNLYIAAVDTNGKVTSESQIISAVVKVDVTNPTLEETGIGIGTQYKNDAFTLSGTASDNGSGLAATNPVTISDGANTYYPTVAAGTGAWSQTITVDKTNHANDGNHTYTITATDAAGRITQIQRTITIDTIKPTVDTFEIANTVTPVSDNGKNWYNSAIIPLEVTAKDTDGTGIKKIEYSTDYNSSTQTGTWTPLALRNNKYTGDVYCENGENIIYVRTTDNADNVSDITNMTIYVDTVAPELTASTYSYDDAAAVTATGSVYVNGSKKLKVSGTYSDAGIGGEALTFKVGDTTITPTLTNSGNNWTIEFTPTSTTAGTLSINGKDKLNNAAIECKPITIVFDNTPPAVTLETPTDADDSTDDVTEVNGVIKLTGTASDNNNKFTVTKLQYKQTGKADETDENETLAPADWTDIDETVMKDPELNYHIASNEDFTVFDFDTTKLKDKATYQLRAVAVDPAGNEGYSTGTDADPVAPVTIKVDQDTDRPVITLSNLTLQESGVSYLKSTKTLYLTVNDDDGIETKEYKKYEDGKSIPKEWETLSGTSITVDKDDKYIIIFKIKDRAGKTFTSTETLSANSPKLTDGKTSRNDNLTFSVATEAPTVKDIKYSVYDTKSTETEDDDEWSAFKSDAGTVGGTRYTKIRISFTAKSVQTVDSAIATYNGNTYTFDCNDESRDDENEHEWTSEPITIGNELNGQQTITLSVKDPVPMESIVSLKIDVDNTKPIVDISKPSSLIGQSETIKGEVNEDVTMYYAVSRYCEMKSDDEGKPDIPDEENLYSTDPVDHDNVIPEDEIKKDDEGTVLATAWEELTREDTGLKWYIYFDEKYVTGSTDTFETDHTAKLGTYLTEDYLGITSKADIAKQENAYEAKTPLWFWIKAVDICGNETIKKQKLDIDPQGERPRVQISYPVNVNDQAPSLGGIIRITGTAEDNNAAKYVWIQIDFDETPGFSKKELTYLINKNYSIGQISENELLTEVPELSDGDNAASDYGIMVEVKGTGWSQTINSSSEFNIDQIKAGGFTMDDDVTTTTLNLTVKATDEDKNISLPQPQAVIIDSNKPYVEQSSLVLIHYNNEGNEDARKPYTQDTIISGKWYLTGSIKDDDSGIAKIGLKFKESDQWSYQINGTPTEEKVYPETESVDSHYYFEKTNERTSGNNKYYDYNFSIPLGDTTTGGVGTSTVYFDITEALTESAQPINPSYSVSYDNKAPEFKTSGSAYIKLSSNVQNSNGFYTFGAIASEAKVEEVNQSGVKQIAFYFTRDFEYGLKDIDETTYSEHEKGTSAKTHDLFDIMIYHQNLDSVDVSSGNMIVGYDSMTNENGLYWHSISGTVSNKTFTYTADTAELEVATKNIHKKGLAKINGTIYLINNVSINGETVIVTLDEAPGDTEANSSTNALFAVCNVIDSSDNNGNATSNETGYGYGYYGSRETDDGDLITESFTNQGSEWYFDASVNSKNLPDGPITLHMVAFDKAGNCSEWASYRTDTEGNIIDLDFVVSNNAPRIAGMIIGTDENGDGIVDDDEFIEEGYSTIYALGYDNKTGDPITNTTLPVQNGNTPNSALTIKGHTEIKPELVGGNGQIYYKYKVYEHTSGLNWKSGNDFEFSKDEAEYVTTGTTDRIAEVTHNETTNNYIKLSVSDFIGTTDGEDEKNIDDGQYKKFEFSFSDSTPGKTKNAGDSKTATLNVIMDVALRESESAKNWILPFYWKSATDNSLFGQSKDNGHIELAKDWVTVDAYDADEEEYDADPKVSGKIKIEGIAQDDTLLRDIKVQFGTSMGGMGTTDTTIASYDYDSAKWGLRSGTGENQTFTAFGDSEPTTIPDSGWVSYIKKATYQDLLDTKIIEVLPVGSDKVQKKASDEVPYTSQDYGHVVHWILYVDTSKVSGVAATNVTITATATDRGKTTWKGDADTGAPDYSPNTTTVTVTPDNNSFSGAVTKDGETVTIADLTGKYRVDVVPYITKLYTGISDTAGEDFARSATGKYIVRGNYLDTDKSTVKTETIKLFGFNLEADSTTGNITIGSTGSIKTTAVAAATNNGKTTPAHLTFPVGTGTSSGKLSITVNSIVSLNNINANPVYEVGAIQATNNSSAMYNSQANGKTNDRLTDDVDLWVWDMSYYLNEVSIWNPMLAIDKKGEFYMSYGYGPSNMYVKKGTGNNSERSVDYSYNKFINTQVTCDDRGNIYAIATNTDRIWDESAKVTLYMSSNQNWYPTVVNSGERSYQKSSTSKHMLEHVFNSATGMYDTDRVMNPSISTYVSGNDTKIAVAYYDNNHTKSPVKFRFGTRSQSGNNAASFSGGIVGFTGREVASNGTPRDSLTEGYSAPDTESGSADGYHVIASSATSIHGGPYTSVGIIPRTDGYTGVVAWYDASSRSLYFSYNEDPDTAVIGEDWQDNAVCLDDDYAGWYVSLATDSDKGIHIAYYKSSTGDLKYAYIPDYTLLTKDADHKLTGGATVVTVDSYLSVGTNISIDVRKEGNNQVPYINYFNSSNNKTCNSIKVAWRKDFTDLRDGAVNDKFTGAWESMTIPTNNIPVEATVCGGVPSSSTTAANNKTVFLGYMSDQFYEKATIKGDVTSN